MNVTLVEQFLNLDQSLVYLLDNAWSHWTLDWEEVKLLPQGLPMENVQLAKKGEFIVFTVFPRKEDKRWNKMKR